MFRRILVPVDGSTFSEQAIPYAIRIAVAFDAAVAFALVHGDYEPVVTDWATRTLIDDAQREQQRRETEYLRELAHRVSVAAGCEIEPVELSGDPAVVLEHEIKERAVELVVMTTHARSGLERAWLGSVADALVRHVAAPVLLIRPRPEAPVSALSTAPPFRHVLIALDGSERAERALDPGVALARADAGRVTLLRVVLPPVGVTLPYIPHAVAFPREELEGHEAQARAYLETKVLELERHGVDVAAEMPIDYPVAHAVLRFADAAGVDLIALGTHGRGPLKRLVLGSVSDKVVRAANVPVLVC